MVDLLYCIRSVKLTSKGLANCIFKDLFFCPVVHGFYYFENQGNSHLFTLFDISLTSMKANRKLRRKTKMTEIHVSGPKYLRENEIESCGSFQLICNFWVTTFCSLVSPLVETICDANYMNKSEQLLAQHPPPPARPENQIKK